MTKRNALSPRLRFEVFKRDGFRCVYCGTTPVESVLHVDHVRPVAAAGDNDPTNLVTACQACNGGKSSVPLGEKRLGPTRTPEEAKDHAEQILAYLEAEKAVVEAKTAVADEVAAEWEKSTGWTTTSQERAFLASSVGRYGMDKMVEAIHIAVAKVQTESRSDALHCFRYLCGIIRRWRETGDCSLFLPPRTSETSVSDQGAVRQLLEWIGADEPTCEICGGNERSDIPRPVRIYRLLQMSLGVPVRPGNLVVLCEGCLERSRCHFDEAAEEFKNKREANLRVFFFRHYFLKLGIEFARAMRPVIERDEGSVSSGGR